MAAAAIRSGRIQACVWVRDVSCVIFQILWVWQKPRHILSSSCSPSFLSPCVFKRNVVHLILIHFCLTQQKVVSRARKHLSSKSSLFNGSLIRISSLDPQQFDHLQTGQQFSFSLWDCTSSPSLECPCLVPPFLPLDSYSSKFMPSSSVEFSSFGKALSTA